MTATPETAEQRKERMARVRAARGQKKPVTAATPATPKRPPMRARPNWEDMSQHESGPDRLHVPKEIVEKLERDYGMSLQWVTDSVYGKPEPQLRAQLEKGGWTPIHAEDFDGVFDGMFLPKGHGGEINMEGQVLMARPVEITRRAQQRLKRDAKLPVQIREQALKGGDLPGVSGTDHPSVRNTVKREFERIEIPEN